MPIKPSRMVLRRITDYSEREQEGPRKEYNLDLISRAKEKRKLCVDLDFRITEGPTTIPVKLDGRGGVQYSYPQVHIPVMPIPKSGKDDLPKNLTFLGDPNVELNDEIRANIFLGEEVDLKPDKNIIGSSWCYSDEFREMPGVYRERGFREKPERLFVYVPRDIMLFEEALILHRLNDGKLVRTWHSIKTLANV